MSEHYDTPNTRKRSYDTYTDDLSSPSTHNSFSTASSTTRRRKRVRSQQRLERRGSHLNELRQQLQYIDIIGMDQPYSKLNPELVVAEPDPLIAEYTGMQHPPIENFDMHDWTFVKACTPVEMNHLKQFDRPIRDMQPEYEDLIVRAASFVSEMLSLPHYLIFPTVDRLAEVKYHPSKFAGVDYARMGMKTRKEADATAQADAEHAWARLMRGEHVTPHDVRLGGRGKVTQMSRSEAERVAPPVGRLILMMSQRDLKLCGVTENQLTAAYLEEKYPISVGLGWFHGNARRFVQRFLPFDKWYCFDAKKYDSSLDGYLVRIAINILRSQYLNGHDAQYEAYWNFVYDSMIETPIFRDDGVRMKKHVGTTSGHSHNTLIQSICTLIVGYAAIMHLHGHLSDDEVKEKVHMEALGDDNILGVHESLAHLSVEDLAKAVFEIFGVDWYGKKSFSTTRLLDPSAADFEGVQYLGKFFYLGDYPQGETATKLPLPYRPMLETYLRLLYPEYGGHTPEETYLRVIGNYMDAAGNPLTERWLQGLLDWLETKVSYVPTTWPDSYRRMLVRDYSRIGVEVPAPARMEFAQWRDLVTMDTIEYRTKWHTRPARAQTDSVDSLS